MSNACSFEGVVSHNISQQSNPFGVLGLGLLIAVVYILSHIPQKMDVLQEHLLKNMYEQPIWPEGLRIVLILELHHSKPCE